MGPDIYNLPMDTLPSYSALQAQAALQQYAAGTSGGVVAWLKANQTAVIITAAALFALAMFGGTRR